MLPSLPASLRRVQRRIALAAVALAAAFALGLPGVASADTSSPDATPTSALTAAPFDSSTPAVLGGTLAGPGRVGISSDGEPQSGSWS